MEVIKRSLDFIVTIKSYESLEKCSCFMKVMKRRNGLQETNTSYRVRRPQDFKVAMTIVLYKSQNMFSCLM